MKMFIIALGILLTILLLLFFNMYFTCRFTDDMLRLLEQPPDSPDYLEKIEGAWDRCRGFLSLSVNSDLIYAADSLLAELRTAYDNKNAAECKSPAERLYVLISYIQNAERVGWLTIF